MEKREMKLVLAAGCVAAMLVMLPGCSKSDDTAGPNMQQEEDELPIVDIDVVHSDNVPQTKQYTATVEAFNSNNITPSAMNRIKTITVDEGDRVSRGQVIATLDESALVRQKVDVDQKQRDYDRSVELLKIGSGTQAAVDANKSLLDAAITQYNNLKENTVLVSPISGVVTARNYDPGDMTGTLPIVTVGQINPYVKILINITENDLSKIKTGMPVDINFDAFPGEDFTGTITRIYPSVDPATRTFQAEVQVANKDSRIFPGMFARVSLDQGAENRVLVPDRAVVKQTGSGNRYVYVYHNGKVSYNKVEVGRQVGTNYEIISGVNDGDTVVIAGQTRLADGVDVQLKEK